MTQQSAIVLQNRWRPETSRVKSKQEGNKKVQGGSRVSGDTGITCCMSIQIHAQCCWSSWSEATCIFACFCFISHLTLCAIDRGFRLCHLCSYEIYISNDKTPKLCETTLSKRKYWKYAGLQMAIILFINKELQIWQFNPTDHQCSFHHTLANKFADTDPSGICQSVGLEQRKTFPHTYETGATEFYENRCFSPKRQNQFIK